MFTHKNIVDKYIKQYGQNLLPHDRELLSSILLNPENKVSGDLFELHNNQAALELVDKVLAKKQYPDFEAKVKQLCKLSFDSDTKSILHMQYGTQKCQFASIEDIYHILKNFPNITTDFTQTRPINHYEHLTLTNSDLLERLFEKNDESSHKLFQEWDEYMVYRMIFFELIKPIRRTIWVDPFIALVKKWLIDDTLDDNFVSLYDSFNAMNRAIENNSIDMEDIRHIVNKVEVYIKRNRMHKVEKMEKDLWASRMSMVLDIIYLKKQLKTQNSIVKKYFNDSNIDNIIIDFFERNYTESWDKIKKMAYILQNKEVFLRAYFNGYLQVK